MNFTPDKADRTRRCPGSRRTRPRPASKNPASGYVPLYVLERPRRVPHAVQIRPRALRAPNMHPPRTPAPYRALFDPSSRIDENRITRRHNTRKRRRLSPVPSPSRDLFVVTFRSLLGSLLIVGIQRGYDYLSHSPKVYDAACLGARNPGLFYFSSPHIPEFTPWSLTLWS